MLNFFNKIFGIFVVGSFSLSTVNYNAGYKSTVSNIVMALTVMVTILHLTPLFY